MFLKHKNLISDLRTELLCVPASVCRHTAHFPLVLLTLDVNTSAPGLHSLPLSEVHVDIGGYKIVHLVALSQKDSRVKKRKQNSNLQSGEGLTSEVSHRNLLPLIRLPIVM